ncbi:putative sporulation protein YtxC [Paenibacillus flagellatus]|uniref:Sporulation protein n=1 Tax=Paenibacillus flagellatus TaxID=2211139 RepID=A0A2V5KFV5_9BACL|nr:putative sporulation protein YtxC [Paenibacillus flagellatus]PYI57434.1 sporulation protein [Paenibacillus flagellatus]
MELFALTLPKEWASYADKLYVRLSLAARDLHTAGHPVRFECDAYKSHTVLRCVAALPEFQLNVSGTPVIRSAAETVAAYVLDEMERKLLRDIVVGQYHYDDEAEVASIEQYCRQVLNQPEPSADMPKPRQRRQNKIADALTAYLEEHNGLNLIGFIRFRLADYMNELCEVAEYAIDEYIMDQQYQEFISLLKYFVYIQETKIPVAHLMHRGGNEFTMYNDQMKPIDTDQFEGFTVELLDKEINFEDMIVSTLISVSPQQIVIHTREPEEQVIKTILQIFENRARVCTYCKVCGTVLTGKNKDQLYP